MNLLSRARHITKGFQRVQLVKVAIRGWELNVVFEVGLKWHLARWMVLALGLEGMVQNLLWQEIVLLHVSSAVESL